MELYNLFIILRFIILFVKGFLRMFDLTFQCIYNVLTSRCPQRVAIWA